MRYVITLTNVQRKDSDTLGFRASDLATLKEKGFNVPLAFVVNSEAFEDFLAANGLRAKTERIILEKPDPNESYQEILALFAKSPMPKDLELELLEAYESLTIEQGAPAHSIISGQEFPFVMLIRSPSYILQTEDEEGILQNLKGPDQLFIGLKLIWATAFSPDSRDYRAKSGISEKYTMSVVVEKMKKTTASAASYSRTEYNEFMLRVKSFLGFQDYTEPLLGKDVHEVDVNSLLIRSAQINVQEHAYARNLENDELVKRALLDDGAKQKLNDKIIAECARLAKRAKSFIGKDVKLYLGIHDDTINVIQANRLMFEKQKEVETREAIVVTEDASGNKVVSVDESSSVVELPEHKKLEMPSLISLDDAKKSITEEHKHKLFSLDGFIEEEKTETQAPAQVIIERQVVPAAETGSVEKKIANEESLLEQVMKVKEHIERMEEHALNGHKEGYEHEARRIKELLKHIRE